MSLETNLIHGRSAINYVKSLGILACNKVEDRLAAAGGIEQMVEARRGRDYTAYAGLDRIRRQELRAPTMGNFRATSEFTKLTKFGNCGEQAILSLVYLYEKGVRPLDLMMFRNDAYDHAWVVIGMNPTVRDRDLRSWGPNAVWCDPWQGEGVVFAISDFIKGRVRNLNANYRCNTLERVERGNPGSYYRAN